MPTLISQMRTFSMYSHTYSGSHDSHEINLRKNRTLHAPTYVATGSASLEIRTQRATLQRRRHPDSGKARGAEATQPAINTASRHVCATREPRVRSDSQIRLYSPRDLTTKRGQEYIHSKSAVSTVSMLITPTVIRIGSASQAH